MSDINEKSSIEHAEDTSPTLSGSATEEEEVPITWRTYLALLSFGILQGTQTWAIVGPTFLPPYIVATVGGETHKNWLPVVSAVGQAVFCPFLAYASDVFGRRKLWLLIPTAVGCIGSIVLATAQTFAALIVGQVFVGMGLATIALTYAGPSEMMPRKWRPTVTAAVAVGTSVGSIGCTLLSGVFAEHHEGWRKVFAIQAGLFALSVIILTITYNPINIPRPPSTFAQKLHKIDIVGNLLLAAGTAILLVGISIGDNPYKWASAPPITMIVIGFLIFFVFGFWEWRRRDGIFNLELFKSRNFSLCAVGLFTEGVLIVVFQVFYPTETMQLWEPRPFHASLRTCVLSFTGTLTSVPTAMIATKFKNLKWPTAASYTLYLVATIGMATVNPHSTVAPWIYSGIFGVGFAPLLVLVVSAAQLSTPRHLIATTSAIMVSSRALGVSTGAAFIGSVVTTKVKSKLPAAVAKAALTNGLPPSEVPAFVGGLLTQNETIIGSLPGVNQVILGAASKAVNSAYSDSYRYAWICMAPFCVVGILSMALLKSNKKTMDKFVDAPMESEEIAKKHAILV